jgi:hypothetical protein
MSSPSQDSQAIAGGIATAIEQASVDMQTLSARVSEIAALAAALQSRELDARDLASVERLESAAQAATFHLQAYERLTRELWLACKALGLPVTSNSRTRRSTLPERRARGGVA